MATSGGGGGGTSTRTNRTVRDTYVIDPRVGDMLHAIRDVSQSHTRMSQQMVAEQQRSNELLAKLSTGWQEFGAQLEIGRKVVGAFRAVWDFFLDDVDAADFPSLAEDVEGVSTELSRLGDAVRSAGQRFLEQSGAIDGVRRGIGGLSTVIEELFPSQRRSAEVTDLQTQALERLDAAQRRRIERDLEGTRVAREQAEAFDYLSYIVERATFRWHDAGRAQESIQEENARVTRGLRELDRVTAEYVEQLDIEIRKAAEAAKAQIEHAEALERIAAANSLIAKQLDFSNQQQADAASAAAERQRQRERDEEQARRTRREGRIEGGGVRDQALSIVQAIGEDSAQAMAQGIALSLVASTEDIAVSFAEQLKRQLKPTNLGLSIGEEISVGLRSAAGAADYLGEAIAIGIESGTRRGVESMGEIFAWLQRGTQLAVDAGLVGLAIGGPLGGIFGLAAATAALASYLGKGSGGGSSIGRGAAATQRQSLAPLGPEVADTGNVTNVFMLAAPEWFTEQAASERVAKLARDARRRNQLHARDLM